MDTILVHMCVGVLPVYALTARKIRRFAFARFCICFLVGIMFVLYEIPRDIANYYDVLDVAPTASTFEIRNAVKKVKKHLSEIIDNDDPEEKAYWSEELQKGSDILTTETFRRNYHRFGDSVDAVMQSGDDQAVAIAVGMSLVRHAIVGIMGFAVTFPQQHAGARTGVLLYTVACIGSDLVLRFAVESRHSLTAWASISNFLNFEIIMLMRRVAPGIFLLCLTFNSFMGPLPHAERFIVTTTLGAVLESFRPILSSTFEVVFRIARLTPTSLHLKEDDEARPTAVVGRTTKGGKAETRHSKTKQKEKKAHDSAQQTESSDLTTDTLDTIEAPLTDIDSSATALASFLLDASRAGKLRLVFKECDKRAKKEKERESDSPIGRSAADESSIEITTPIAVAGVDGTDETKPQTRRRVRPQRG